MHSPSSRRFPPAGAGLKLLGALLTLALAPGAASVAADLKIEPLQLEAFDTAGIRHLAQDRRMAVATYRIGIVTQGGARTGFSEDTLHDIADRAYGDLVRRLRATRREVVPAAELRELPAYKGVSITRHRMHRVPLGDGRELALVAGMDHDLILTQLDTASGSGDAAAEGNGHALAAVSAAINAVVLVPTVVIEIDAQGLAFAPHLTSLAVYHSTSRDDEELGQAVLRARGPIAPGASARKLDEDAFDEATAAANQAFAEAAATLHPN
jgi:hypothetical protein